METASQALHQLEQCGAVLRDGHFVYTSGRHGPCYVNKDAVYLHPHVVSSLCRALATRFDERFVEIVVGPAIGGVILAQWTAYALEATRDVPAGMPRDHGIDPVRAAYAEKGADGVFKFNRGYRDVVSGARVLVVEDVLTTGASAKGVVDAVLAAGGVVVGVAALVNRGGVAAADLGVSCLATLASFDFDTYPADDCPLCRRGVPVNTVLGKGLAFLAERAAQAQDDFWGADA